MVSQSDRYRAMRVALVIAGCAIASPVAAQEWPSRAVTIVVPLAAGSASDIAARVVADQLSKQLKATFIVENRTGAGGTVGAGAVARSAPDGHTILAYGALSIAHALYAKLPYDTLNDFIPVIPLGQQAQAITTAPSKGYKTLGDLIAAGKAKPGALNYSSAGVGSASHFAAERVMVAAGFTAAAYPVQGLGRVAPRNHRGPRGLQHSVVRDNGSAHSERHAVAARGQCPQTLRTRAECADHDRGGFTHGIRLCVLHRHLPPGEDAAQHRREASRRDRQGVAVARGTGAIQESRG